MEPTATPEPAPPDAEEERGPWIARHFSVATFAFATFLMAGAIKSDPRLASLPDLTLVAAGVTVACCVKAFIDRGFRLNPQIHWMVGLFALFAVPILWSDLLLAYPLDKAQKLFSFTLLAAIAPFFILETRADHRRLLNAVALIGLVMTFDAASKVAGGASLERLTAFDSTTIATGRAAAIPLIWIAILALEARLAWVAAMPLMAVTAVILFFSGSRGPLLATVAVMGGLGVAFYRARLKQAALLVATFAVLGLALSYSAAYAPSSSIARIDYLLRGEINGSELARIEYAKGSWDLLQRHPLGTGWGGVAVHLGSGGEVREYPHNFVLETVVEAGWAAGLWLLALCLAAAARLLARSGSAEARANLALLGFLVMNALVSGDLNDNKLLLAFLGVALAFGAEEDEAEAREAAAEPPVRFA